MYINYLNKIMFKSCGADLRGRSGKKALGSKKPIRRTTLLSRDIISVTVITVKNCCSFHADIIISVSCPVCDMSISYKINNSKFVLKNIKDFCNKINSYHSEIHVYHDDFKSYEGIIYDVVEHTTKVKYEMQNEQQSAYIHRLQRMYGHRRKKPKNPAKTKQFIGRPRGVNTIPETDNSSKKTRRSVVCKGCNSNLFEYDLGYHYSNYQLFIKLNNHFINRCTAKTGDLLAKNNPAHTKEGLIEFVKNGAYELNLLSEFQKNKENEKIKYVENSLYKVYSDKCSYTYIAECKLCGEKRNYISFEAAVKNIHCQIIEEHLGIQRDTWRGDMKDYIVNLDNNVYEYTYFVSGRNGYVYDNIGSYRTNWRCIICAKEYMCASDREVPDDDIIYSHISTCIQQILETIRESGCVSFHIKDHVSSDEYMGFIKKFAPMYSYNGRNFKKDVINPPKNVSNSRYNRYTYYIPYSDDESSDDATGDGDDSDASNNDHTE